MEKIKLFIRSYSAIIILTAFIVFMFFIAAMCGEMGKNEPLVLDKQNPELLRIKEYVKSEIAERESKILILETKIEALEKTKTQQSWNLSNSTQNLETEIVEVVKIVQDSTLIFLLDRVKIEQKTLVKTYENIIELKDSVIFENENIIQSYVFATEKLSNEIEVLHSKNNELLIIDSRNKGKIKKRNRIIIIGCSAVAAGITGVILLSK